MRMRDLKDALKGKTERLERAEALLIEALQTLDTISGITDEIAIYNDALAQRIKIEHFFKKPIDNEK